MTVGPAVDEALRELSEEDRTLVASIRRHQIEMQRDETRRNQVRAAMEALRPLSASNMNRAIAEAEEATATDASTEDRVLALVRRAGRIADVEILLELQREGWTTTSQEPLAMIRSYLTRLVQAGQLNRVARSTYVPANVINTTNFEVGAMDLALAEDAPDHPS